MENLLCSAGSFLEIEMNDFYLDYVNEEVAELLKEIQYNYAILPSLRV